MVRGGGCGQVVKLAVAALLVLSSTVVFGLQDSTEEADVLAAPLVSRLDMTELGSVKEAEAALKMEEKLPIVCHSTCMPGKCVGAQGYKCTECVQPRVLQKMTSGNETHKVTLDYGQCDVCPSSCKPGKCTGASRSGDQCTECYDGRVFVPNPGGAKNGQCVRCASSCKYRECVGERGDQCKACNFPYILIKSPFWNKNSTIPEHGTCTKCASSCTQGKCVGEGGGDCTACPSDRKLVLSPAPSGNGTASYGQCVTCSGNCLLGKCVGKHAYQCTACAANKVLIKASEGPHAGKPYGPCVQCAYTCSPRQCVGERTWQCTGCPTGRTLVQKDKTKAYGYCAANSVVKNTMLSDEIKAQAAEIKQLKAASAEEQMLAVSRAQQDILGDTEAVQNLANSVFSATESHTVGPHADVTARSRDVSTGRP